MAWRGNLIFKQLFYSNALLIRNLLPVLSTKVAVYRSWPPQAVSVFEELSSYKQSPSFSIGIRNGICSLRGTYSSSEVTVDNPFNDSATSAEWVELQEEWKRKVENGETFRSFPDFVVKRVHMLLQKQHVGQAYLYQKYLLFDTDCITNVNVSFFMHLCTLVNDTEGILWAFEYFKNRKTELEPGRLRLIIKGLCQTDRWQEGIDLMYSIQDSNLSSSACGKLIETACDKHEIAIAENLFYDMLEKNVKLPISTYDKLLKSVTYDTTKSRQLKRKTIVSKLLMHFRENGILPSSVTASSVAAWFKSQKDENWKTTFTSITPHGICRSCKQELEMLKITDADFKKLREQVIEKVISGNDIYKKTTPEEFNAFMKFVDTSGEYDLVIDGLNLAFLRHPIINPSIMLRKCVEYLVNTCQFRCLIIGREHMRTGGKWIPRHMKVVTDIADCFFTTNISSDDPFMLYATLKSGSATKYVSRDLFRDHKNLLDPELHISFSNWQRRNQLFPVEFRNGKLHFEPLTKHDTIVQSTDDSWHIPYVDENDIDSNQRFPLTWLCLKKKS